jgi:hypothetical protein
MILRFSEPLLADVYADGAFHFVEGVDGFSMPSAVPLQKVCFRFPQQHSVTRLQFLPVVSGV